MTETDITQSLGESLGSWAALIACILFFFYGLSLLARLHWIPDLFSHFTIQYAIGAFILAIVLALTHYHILAFFCLLVCVANLVETRHLMQTPWGFTSSATAHADLHIMQFNKFYANNRYERIEAWLRAHPEIDILMVQESGADTIDQLKKFEDIFPHQFPLNPAERYNDVSILSRHPFDVTPVPTLQGTINKFASRITLRKAGLAKPVIIYSYHTITPMNRHFQRLRNAELLNFAGRIRQEKESHVVAAGDWNITPYSPYFADFLKISGMRYQNYSLLPQTSWPSFNFFSFFQIPIDHIVYSENMNMVSITRGPALGSDHHALIGAFAVKE